MPGARVAFAVPEDHIAGGFRPGRPPRSTIRSLTLRFGAGYEDSADGGLVIPIDGTVIGQVWATGEPTLRIFGPATRDFFGTADAHRRARVPRDLAWGLALPAELPFFGDPEHDPPVRAVVVIDSCHAITNDEATWDEFESSLARLTFEEILPIFRT
jgi:hypothetical protein